MKIEPSAKSRLIATRLHEMFVAYQDAGFDEEQAFRLVQEHLYIASERAADD